MTWGMAAAGLLSYFAGQQANKANLAASREASRRQQDREKQVAATGNMTGGPLGSQSFGPEGFKQDFGPAGAAARESLLKLNRGDVGRAGAINRATSDFKLNIPTLADARGITEQKRNDRNRIIRDTLAERDLGNRRTFRDANTGADANLIGQIARLNTDLPGQAEAVNLFQQSQGADLGNLQKTIAANQAQGVRAENYPRPSLGGTATLAQIPITQPTPDISGTLAPSNLGNLFKKFADAKEVKRLEGKSDVARREIINAWITRQQGNQYNAPSGGPFDYDVGTSFLS